MTGIAQNLLQVKAAIAEAARRSGRDPASVELVAVSKTFGPEAVAAALEAGQTVFGENRVQEAEAKIPAVATPGARWHLIGHLQSNKARRAVQLFDVVQTVDSQKLARALDRHAAELGRRLRVFIEVNVGGEQQKAGISPEDLPALVSIMPELPHLEFAGLMAIPPYSDDPEASRPYFRRLAGLRTDIAAQAGKTPGLSMGMSHDFRVAIEEGATVVRIGTAIFGSRRA